MRNGNRYITEVEGKGVFLRDTDKLFSQYANLRYKVYNQYVDDIPNSANRAELMSYINEEFVKLVKEYDINGEVDFPGYIKKKLGLRVKGSYIKKLHKNSFREPLGESDDSVDFLLNTTGGYQNTGGHLDYPSERELLNTIFSGVDLQPIEIDIVNAWLDTPNMDIVIAKDLVDKYKETMPDITKAKVKEYMQELRFYITRQLKEMN